MKVLELCLSTGVGGLELYAAKVIQHLSDWDTTEVLPVIRRGTLMDKRMRDAGINVNYLEVRNRHFPVLTARKLARLIDTHGIDVVHMHWARDLLLAVLAKIFCKRDIRLVYTRQMAISRDKHDRYHQFVYRHVDVFITITELLRQQSIRFLPIAEQKVRLLYYGVPAPEDTDKQHCAAFYSQAGLGRETFKIGLFGRIEPGKGQHLLLQAIRQLRDSDPQLQALLVGHVMDQGYLDDLMSQAAQAGLSENFLYYGFHENPTSIMGCLDLVVLASNEETFGLVLVEAMRAGTAVIGTDAGGVPEIIQHKQTGMLFRPGDSEQLAEDIVYLQENPVARHSMAAAGKQFADQHFSEEQHFSALRQLLAG